MAESKWKYASLPANERLQLVRQGNEDVYKSEMARTSEIIKAREQAGLDTEAQVKWANQLGYQYNLNNAEKMGISAERVDKSGYGEALTSAGRASQSSKAVKESEPKKRSAFFDFNALQYSRMKSRENEIRKAYAKYKDIAAKSFERSAGILREALVNQGAGANGGKMISEELGLREALAGVLAEYDSEMENALAQNRSQYENIIADYRKGMLDIANSNAYKAQELANETASLELKKQAQEDAEEKWRASLEFDREKESNDVAKWQASLAFDIGKEQADNQNRRAELESDSKAEATRHAEWLAEYKLKQQKQQTDYDIWYAEHYGTK